MARDGNPICRQIARLSIRRLSKVANFAWGVWAIIGGIYFLQSKDTLGNDTAWHVFGNEQIHGYYVVGVSLVVCGVISLFSVLCPSWMLQKVAAIVCGVWCFTCAVVLQWATPEVDQGDIDAWLLIMCAFTCGMRWAVLHMESTLDR